MIIFICIFVSIFTKKARLMKKVAIGFVMLLVGLGVAATPSLIALSSLGDSSEEIGGITEDKNSGLMGQPTESKEEDPGKDKNKEITASIDINPNKLNCKSKGRWITAFIGLPSEYDTEDIAISTISLTTSLGQIETSENFPNAIVDINGDNVPELMVKFDRSDLINILEHMQFCNIKINGELQDKTQFEGGGAIELIHYS
jgi:hypothetical protein